MASVNEFRANFRGMGARPNRFRINMTFPTLVPNAAVAGRTLRVLGKGASLPGQSIGQAPVFYHGRTINLPGDRVFEPWTVTIYNDEDFLLKSAFESWQNLINTHRGNLSLAPMPLLMTNPTVDQLGKDDTVLKSYQFWNMWPMEISPIELDFGSNDNVEEFQVTFMFDEWTSNSTPG